MQEIATRPTTGLTIEVAEFTAPAFRAVLPDHKELLALADNTEISDESGLKAASSLSAAIGQRLKGVTALFKPLKDTYNNYHKNLLQMEKDALGPLEAGKKKINAKILSYQEQVAAENKRRAEEELENLLPGEDPEPILVPTPDLDTVTRNLPTRAEIDDPVALCQWCAAGGPERIAMYIEFRQQALNADARRLGEFVGKSIPGVRAVRDKTVVSR